MLALWFRSSISLSTGSCLGLWIYKRTTKQLKNPSKTMARVVVTECIWYMRKCNQQGKRSLTLLCAEKLRVETLAISGVTMTLNPYHLNRKPRIVIKWIFFIQLLSMLSKQRPLETYLSWTTWVYCLLQPREGMHTNTASQ